MTSEQQCPFFEFSLDILCQGAYSVFLGKVEVLKVIFPAVHL